jgi:hypothetical protein
MGAVVEPSDEEWDLVKHLFDPRMASQLPREQSL